MHSSRSTQLLLIALFVLNLVLKCLWLGVNELAHDEPFTVYWSQRSLAELWSLMRTENNPPLYFLVIKAWTVVTPFQTSWLRVPSAVFGAVAVWPLFLLARRLSGTGVAIVASLLFTCSNYHYGFAHEVRAYSLFTLLSITSIWLLVRGKDKPGNGLRAMLGLSALNVLLIYTHFFGWLMIGIQLLCVLLLPELRHLRRNFFFGLGVTTAWYVPYASVFIGRLGQSVANGTWLDTPVPEEIYNMIWRWSNAPVLAVLFLVVIIFALWRTKLKDLGQRIGIIWAFVPLIGMFAVSFFAPMFLDRYLVYAAPGFALLVAISLAHLFADTRITIPLSVVAILGMAITFTPWKQGVYHPSRVVAQVDAWKDGAVLIEPSWYELTYLWANEDRDCFLVPEDERPWCMGKGLMWSTNGGEDIPVDPRTEEQVVLVDATNGEADLSRVLKHHLREALPNVDSVEADHKVWVFRFRR